MNQSGNQILFKGLWGVSRFQTSLNLHEVPLEESGTSPFSKTSALRNQMIHLVPPARLL